MEWYYVEGGRAIGPVSDKDFADLVRQGKIASDTLVWRPGMADWASYSSLTRAVYQSAPHPDTTRDSLPHARCCECGKHLPVSSMVRHGTDHICAQCKPVFFQRIQEGVLPSQGNTPNRELMAQGLSAVRRSWLLAIGVIVVFTLINFAVVSIPCYIGHLFWLFLGGSFELGSVIFFLALGRGREVNFGMLFEGFSRYWHAFLAYVLRGVFIFLWAMLFMIPMLILIIVGGAAAASDNGGMILGIGMALLIPLAIPAIVASFAYSMTFYIIADDDAVNPYEAIVRSARMMRGKKWKLFCLYLRFVGWTILALFTCCIGFLWLAPYVSTTLARFYDDVKGRAAAQT